ncbi:hypothetical protein ACE6H2_021350 [Prunus campanulata]
MAANAGIQDFEEDEGTEEKTQNSLLDEEEEKKKKKLRKLTRNMQKKNQKNYDVGCCMCLARFNTLGGLQSHQIKHCKFFKACQVCSLRFASHLEYQDHQALGRSFEAAQAELDLQQKKTVKRPKTEEAGKKSHIPSSSAVDSSAKSTASTSRSTPSKKGAFTFSGYANSQGTASVSGRNESKVDEVICTSFFRVETRLRSTCKDPEAEGSSGFCFCGDLDLGLGLKHFMVELGWQTRAAREAAIRHLSTMLFFVKVTIAVHQSALKRFLKLKIQDSSPKITLTLRQNGKVADLIA